MKQLIIRNFKLRRWTLIIYLVLIVINPIYTLFFSKTSYGFVVYIPLAITLMIISILDSGQLFRVHRRLGGKESYLFYESLPITKKELLNANYLTCIILTILGTLIIGLYNFQSTNIQVNELRYSTALSFLSVNLFSIPIAFSKSTERKREYISYTVYIILMVLVIPMAIAFIFLAINVFIFHNALDPNVFNKYLSIGLVIISVIWLVINYFIQIARINRR